MTNSTSRKNMVVFFVMAFLILIAIGIGFKWGAEDKEEDRYGICMSGCYHILEETGAIPENVDIYSFNLRHSQWAGKCDDYCDEKYRGGYNET